MLFLIHEKYSSFTECGCKSEQICNFVKRISSKIVFCNSTWIYRQIGNHADYGFEPKENSLFQVYEIFRVISSDGEKNVAKYSSDFHIIFPYSLSEDQHSNLCRIRLNFMLILFNEKNDQNFGIMIKKRNV